MASFRYLSRRGKRVKIKGVGADTYSRIVKEGLGMTIDRLGPVDPVAKYNKTAKTSRPASVQGRDSIDLSEEAQAKAELLRAMGAVRNTPDIREDRIAEVRRKLEDPNYIDERIKGIVADRIVDMFGF